MTWALVPGRAASLRRVAVFAAALLSTGSATLVSPLRAQSAECDGDRVSRLPLHESPVASGGHDLVFLITGDGGYAAGDRGIAASFVTRGIPVVALDSRAYLKTKRVPDEVARDAACTMSHYLTAWHRDSVVFVGYSRGADLAPFVVTRLPTALRSRLALVAMVGLAERASFQFHWTDLVMESRRSTDYPVAPEVLKMHGVPMLCLYGAHEKESLCPAFPAGVLRVEQHGGGHALSGGDGAEVAQLILRDLAM